MDCQKEIVKNLRGYNPEKIILFGSYAWGKPNEDSDYDLLIIKDTKENFYNRIPEARKRLYGIKKAFDILVLTPQEVKDRLRKRDFFIEDIINKGKVLYEGERR